MSDIPAPSAGLASFLPYQLSIASNAVSGRIAEQYQAQFGLKVPEWRVMAVLGDHGAATQRELTELTLMDKVAVNRACKVLEDRGLALRQANPDDGRSHHLALTGEGKKIHDQVMPLARQMETLLFDGFSSAERAQFESYLKRLRNRATTVD